MASYFGEDTMKHDITLKKSRKKVIYLISLRGPFLLGPQYSSLILLCKVLQEQPYLRKNYLKRVEILERLFFFLSHDTILILCLALYYSPQRYSFTQIINILIHSQIYALILKEQQQQNIHTQWKPFLDEFNEWWQKRGFLYPNLYLPIQKSLSSRVTYFEVTALGEYTIKKNITFFNLKSNLLASVLQRAYGNEHYDCI